MLVFGAGGLGAVMICEDGFGAGRRTDFRKGSPLLAAGWTETSVRGSEARRQLTNLEFINRYTRLRAM